MIQREDKDMRFGILHSSSDWGSQWKRRADLFTYIDDDIYRMAISHAKDNPFKDYPGFLRELGELTEDEQSLCNGSAENLFISSRRPACRRCIKCLCWWHFTTTAMFAWRWQRKNCWQSGRNSSRPERLGSGYYLRGVSENSGQRPPQEDSADADAFPDGIGERILRTERRVCIGTFFGRIGRSGETTCFFGADGWCYRVSYDGLLPEKV